MPDDLNALTLGVHNVTMDFVYDPERAVAERAAGPWGVRVVPNGDAESPWCFTLFGFPIQADAMVAADAEIRRRFRAAGRPLPYP
jgi:hypothetical protein